MLQVYNPEFVRAARKRQAKRILEQQIRQANDAIRKANLALRRLHETDGDIGRTLDRLCRVFRVLPAQVTGRRQTKQVVLARHAVMYWLFRRTGLSHTEIGRRLGGYDHSTVVHARHAYIAKRKRMGRTLRDVA